MVQIIVSVFDRAANAFGRPIFVSAIGAAVRSFQDEINREAQDNSMFHHPDDFDLYELGTFDDADGRFEALDRPRQVALGKQLKS
jgi:hypothetical protein